MATREQGNIDGYSIYTPPCEKGTPYAYERIFERSRRPLTKLPPYDPCTAFYSTSYMNLPDVQKAMHANTSGFIEYPWQLCSMPIYDNWTTYDPIVSMLPIYKELIGAGLKIWVFSGDTDTAVPLSATRRSLAALGLPVKTSWYPWYIVPTEVGGGWSMEYDEGLTLVTVRGAGHEVPLHRPEQALFVFQQFLLGEPMPAEAKNGSSLILLPASSQ